MGFLQINKDEAKAAAEWREAKSSLKPIGLYKVQAVTCRPPQQEDYSKTPYLSFELRIIGKKDASGKGYAQKENGDRRFVNGRLFFQTYFSAKSLFAIEDLLKLMGQSLTGDALIDKLESFATPQKMAAWANGWLDTELEFVVYVGHDLTEGKKPSEKVSLQK